MAADTELEIQLAEPEEQPSATATAVDQSNQDSSAYSPHAIIVNPVQRSNPVLRHFRNVPWEIRDIIPDYILGQTCCALFLSVRYHILHPDYIHGRLQQLGKRFDIRVLLLLVDTSDCHHTLQQAARLALLADCTLMVAWSYEEAARYLETYKVYENKPPEILMERMGSDHASRATECLTTVRKVNKTDAATLMNTFGTMEGIVMASKEELSLCPGLGPHKADRLHKLFQEPFIKTKTHHQL